MFKYRNKLLIFVKKTKKTKTIETNIPQKFGLKSLANFCPHCQNLLGLRKQANGRFLLVCFCGYSKILYPKKGNHKTKELLYRCSTCGRTFTQKKSYFQHCVLNGHNLNEIFKDYKKQGLSLNEMIKKENNRKRPKSMKRNLMLSYLMKMNYNFECQVCTVQSNLRIGDKIEVHHVIPLSKNGKDHSENLITLCQKHHKAVHKDICNKNKKRFLNKKDNFKISETIKTLTNSVS